MLQSVVQISAKLGIHVGHPLLLQKGLVVARRCGAGIRELERFRQVVCGA